MVFPCVPGFPEIIAIRQGVKEILKFVRDAAKKGYFSIAVPIRSRLGGGLKAVPLRKKTFFKNFFSDDEVPTAIKLEGRVKALIVLLLKKIF